MPEHKYRLTYQADPHPDGLTKDELPEGAGACDALVLMSLIYPKDGSYSWDLVTHDGRSDAELDGDELWKAWLMLTRHLSLREDMRPGKKEVCTNIFNQVSMLLKNTAPEEMH